MIQSPTTRLKDSKLLLLHRKGDNKQQGDEVFIHDMHDVMRQVNLVGLCRSVLG